MTTGEAVLWQGFEHEWLREVLGFRLPHRISRLTSYVDGADPTAPVLRVAQAPGVDGNYMRPSGTFTRVRAPGLSVTSGSVRMQWTDQTEGDDHPRAESTVERVVELDGVGERAAAVLRGFELETRCDPDKQGGAPWNSHGMWPYRMAFAVSEVDPVGRFCIEVQMHRAWTPNKGGIPGIEEKALNRCLDFDLTVHYDVLAGAPGAVSFTRADEVTAAGRGHDRDGMIHTQTLRGEPGYPACAAGLVGFGFTLSPPTTKKRHLHRGRYLTALGFGARQTAYDADAGEARVEHRARLWLPSTVVDSEVSYQTRALMIQLGAGAVVDGPHQVTGCICSESSPQAPFFSRWKRCGRDKTGPAQTADAIALKGSHA